MYTGYVHFLSRPTALKMKGVSDYGTWHYGILCFTLHNEFPGILAKVNGSEGHLVP